MSNTVKAQKPLPAPPRDFFHEENYAHNDSVQGVLAAVRAGKPWIDLNFNVTRDLHPACTHWDQPLLHGWYDPAGKIPIDTHVYEMTMDQLRTLRYKDDKSLRIRTASEILAVAARHGVNVEFEAKGSLLWKSKLPWWRLKVVVEREKKAHPGWRLQVKMLSTFSTWKSALHNAHTVTKVPTILLVRGLRHAPRSSWLYLTYVRSYPVLWTGIAPRVPALR